MSAMLGYWSAAFVGAAVGGTQGTAASLDNFNYNYLAHHQIAKANNERAALIQAIQACQATLGAPDGCTGQELSDLEDGLRMSIVGGRQLSDQNIISLIDVCSTSFDSDACNSKRQDLLTSLDDDAGLEQSLLKGSPINTPDALLSQVLADVDSGKITPDQIDSAYQHALQANQTDPSVRSRVGVSLDDISGDSYQYTQQIGTWARQQGYDGILAPSARDVGGSNIVVLQP
ncbi:RES family NAD+ phosphorylase [Rhizobium rhizogenes]